MSIKLKWVGLTLPIFINPLFISTAVATPQEDLGRLIYFDTNLSEPAGQACASCHSPDAGFADPDQNLPVSEGVIAGRFGGRNSPSSSYASFSPIFSYSVNNGAIGGQFWDGRAADLAAQAKGPLLNPVEMNNPDAATVIEKVKASSYATLFEQVYGVGALQNVTQSFEQLAQAVAAFESTTELHPFTSKYDAVQAGLASFTSAENRGQTLFNGNANCSQCHTSNHMMGGGSHSALFTDFRYHNLGIAKNTEYPLDQQTAIDLGLGGVLNVAAENGKFKTPHLRNIALSAPYMHNGLLKSLKEVVHFYNTRDVPGLWPAPEVTQNVNTQLLGNLGLTDAQENDIVAFMMTFSDGYTSTATAGSGMGGRSGGGM